MSKPNQKKRIPPWGAGLIGVVLVVFGFYLGFTKKLPFTGHGYEVKAVFSNAQSMRVKSPVRIAGVDVGKVSKVEHLTSGGEGQQAAVITMELKDTALPLKQDSTFQIRPRLFLEGNLFIDLHPGSPESPSISSGDTIPIAQTSSSVQVDQVLTSLQAPVRADLQTFLIEFGNGLDKYGGGEGLRTVFKTSPQAFRSTSEVNQALLGTQPGDLTGLVVNLDSFIQALNQNQVQLQDLVTNLGTVLNAFGREDRALQTAIFTLPQLLSVGTPALVKLNAALPQLRAFSREALPGVRSAGPALDAANPFIAQLRKLVRPSELRGLVADLVPTVPSLANLANKSLPFLEQARLVSSCFNHVVIPWANTTVPSTDGVPTGPVYKETGYGLAGIGGESRNGDGNGQYIRTGLSVGTNSVNIGPLDEAPGSQNVGQAFEHLIGAEPPISSSAKTPFNPGAPCENQDPPNLDSGGAVPIPGQSQAASRSTSNTDLVPNSIAPYVKSYTDILSTLSKAGAEKGPGAAAAQADAFQQLQDFYKNKMPQYRKALGGGGR
ncbi:MAG: MlaD family protein [Solirubrobacterales bacterium]